MRTVDATSLVDLSAQVTRLRAALPAPLPAPTAVTLPLPPIPIHLSIITTVMRGTTTIGYVITSFAAPAPTAANVTLAIGTLWIEAAPLGAPFALTAGFAGRPSPTPRMTDSRSVTF